MTQQLYFDLWKYSEQFSRDPLQRSELLAMAWEEGVRLGNRSTRALMKSVMHFRSKESALLEDLTAGYKHHEICRRHHITYPQFKFLHQSVQEKAVAYL